MHADVISNCVVRITRKRRINAMAVESVLEKYEGWRLALIAAAEGKDPERCEDALAWIRFFNNMASNMRRGELATIGHPDTPVHVVWEALQDAA